MTRFVLEYDYVAKAEVTVEALDFEDAAKKARIEVTKPGRDAIQHTNARITLHSIRRES